MNEPVPIHSRGESHPFPNWGKGREHGQLYIIYD